MDNDTSNNVSDKKAQVIKIYPGLFSDTTPDLPENHTENMTFRQKIKKYMLMAGTIIAGLILIIIAFGIYDWYTSSFIPEKNKLEAQKLASEAQKFQPQERIAFLNKVIADTSSQNKKSHARNLIREAEEEISREKLRLEQEARKRAEKLRQEKLRLEQKRREHEMLEKYQQALTQNHSGNIYIIKEKNSSLSRYFLFRHDTGFEAKLRKLQQNKLKITAFRNFADSMIKLYRTGSLNNSVDVSEWLRLKKENAEAEKLLPQLSAEVAAEGSRLIIDADEFFYSNNSVFCDIPTGKWLIAGISDHGNIIFHSALKTKNLPVFLKSGKNGFRDISSAHYNEEEKNVIREKKLARMNAEKRRKQKVRKAGATGNISAAAMQSYSKPGNGKVEFQIGKPVFFAALQKNLHARGGIAVKSKLKPVFSMTDGVKAIKFPGDPRQAVAFKWQAITGDSPRTVSLWFYCSGYNRHDSGNAILSYGRKAFGEYFDIETNRSRALHCAWGEPASVLAENIQNNRWNHFAITYDGSERICYLNGKAANVHQTVLKTPASVLMIGARLNDTNHCFKGSIRNVAVYDRALSPDEVKQLSSTR